MKKLVKERTQDLQIRTQTLEEANIALKVLLKHREEDKRVMGNHFVMNIQKLIMPLVDKLKENATGSGQSELFNMIELRLHELTSPLIQNIQQCNLTPTEIEVACLVREGKTTKEIARMLGVATSSVDTHRNSIRKKLGISRTGNNLRSTLHSLS